MNNVYIKEKVKSIINKYHTNNPYKLAEALDVVLLYVPLKGVNGFYQFYENNHIIYINNQLNADKQKYVLAHELGHLLLHKDIRQQYSNNIELFEYEANLFAYELLII